MSRNGLLGELDQEHIVRSTRIVAHDAYRAWERLRDATTNLETAYATEQLNDAMRRLVSWLPDWDYETGVLHDPEPEPAYEGSMAEELRKAWRQP